MNNTYLLENTDPDTVYVVGQTLRILEVGLGFIVVTIVPPKSIGITYSPPDIGVSVCESVGTEEKLS